MKKRVLSMLLAMVMILSTFSLAISATEAETPTATNVTGLTVTVDGVKNASEGWSAEPLFQTTQATESVFSETGVADTTPSSLYISTDGEYVYFFYEIVRPELVGSDWKSNGNGGWIMPALSLYFAPADANFLELEKEDGAIFLNFRVFKKEVQTGVTAIEGIPGSYKWTSKKIAETQGKYTDFLGGVCYGSDWYTNGNEDGTSPFADVAEIALNRATDANGKETKLSIEIAFKLNEETATALQTGTAEYRVGAYEATHKYGETVKADAGYMLSEKITASESADNNGKYNFDATCGATFTLPQAVEVEPPVLDTPEFTMDGIMGEDEGWDGVRVYEFDQHVYDGTGKDAIHRDERVETVTGESNIRFSYDAENIYIYYETSNYDTLNHENGNGGLLLRIAPEVGVDMRGHGYADGTYFYIWLNLTNNIDYEGRQPTNEDAVGSIYDFTFVHDTDCSGNACDKTCSWGLGALTLINQFGFQGWYEDWGDYLSGYAKNSLIALHVEKDENDVGIKKSIEMKLPMPALYKERIAANEENGTNDPVFYFVAYERSRTYNGTYEPMVRDEATGDVADTGTSNAGYFVSLDEETPIVWGFADPGYKENSRMEYGAPVTLTEYVPEVHTNFGKTVTVNGHMDEGEGWSYSPLFQTTLNTNGSKTDILNNSQPDTNPTTIRVSCDGQKVYFFIETTHEDTLQAAWQDCNPEVVPGNDGKDTALDWQTPAIYLHFYPDSDIPRSTYGADNGRWFTLGLTTFSTLALKDANFDENGDFIWDMNNLSGQAAGISDQFFWRLQWGPEAANQYSKDYCLAGVELAAHIDKNDEGKRTKLSIEFAFPLAQEVVAELEDGDLDYKIAFFERNNVYKDMSAENPEYVISKDGGYLIEDVYVDSRLKTDEADFGIPVVLKQNTEGVYADFVEWFEDYKANAEYDNLKNLVVNFLGDDYFLGGKIADYYKWTTMIDEIYNWNITNYVEEGIMTSTYDDIQLFPLSRLYRSMSSNTPNVVLVSGGLNDYLNGTPIGTINDTDTDTYMGALNTLIDGLRDKYRDACIVFTTVYNFEGSIEGSTLTSEDYATALKEVCEYKKVYCLDLYDAETYGIDMSSAEFRAEYCQSADDTVNLNLEGNKLLLATYEKFVSESLTDWAANKDAMLAAWEATKPASGNNGGNTGNNGGNNSGNTDNNNDNKPTETTPAPAPTEPEKKGCKGVIGVGSALAVLAIVSCAGAVCFKKHD